MSCDRRAVGRRPWFFSVFISWGLEEWAVIFAPILVGAALFILGRHLPADSMASVVVEHKGWVVVGVATVLAYRFLTWRSVGAYRTMYQAHPVPSLWLDTRTLSILEGNQAAARFFGVEPQELAGRSLPQLMPGLEAWFEHCAIGPHLEWCYLHRRPSGEVEPLVVALLARPSRYGRSVLVFRTKKHSAEYYRHLRRDRDAIQRFMMHMPLPAWILDGNGTVLLSNTLYQGGAPCALYKEGLACSKRGDGSCREPQASLADILSVKGAWHDNVAEVIQTHQVKDARLKVGACGLWRTIFFPIERNSAEPLVGVVAMDLTAMTREQARAQAYNRSLKELTARMHQVRETERAEVARDIHDQLGQELSLLRFTIRQLKQGLMGGMPAPGALEVLARLEHQIAGAAASARRIALNLRPETLYNLGLPAATELLVEEFRQNLGIRGAFMADPSITPVDHAIALHIYRSVQELLNNVARHAQASHFSVAISLKAHAYVLCVTDNGQGIPPDRQASGRLGLLGLQERAALFSGRITIETRPVFEGTRITVEFPMNGLNQDVPVAPLTFKGPERRKENANRDS